MLLNINNKTQFEVLFNQLGIGVMCVNSLGEIVAANSKVLDDFGYSEAELLNKKVEILIPHRFKKSHESHRHHYSRHPVSRPIGSGIQLAAVKKDGTEFPVEVALCSYTVEDQPYILTFVVDLKHEGRPTGHPGDAYLDQKLAGNTKILTAINDQVQLNEQRINELLKELHKGRSLNELKSRFVSIAAHEFRTPLAGISTSTYLLSKYTREDEQPQREKHIDRIKSSLALLSETIDNFLSMDRIETENVIPHPSTFSVGKLVEESIQEWQHVLRKGQSFSYTHNGTASEIFLDKDMLRHILINLLSNAAKYSPEGSLISILTQRDKYKFSLSITDRGIGISEEDQKKLFNRFFRGSNVNSTPGTGLGLNIVKRYVELMQGTITCISEINKGTTFIVSWEN